MTRNILIAVVGIVLTVGIFFGARYILEQQKGPSAQLKITSVPTASIFIDSRHVGRTPLEDNFEPGEYTIKLIPEGSTEQVIPWQGKVKLGKNLLTYINRELGQSELISAGEVLTLEKISDKNAEIMVQTTPDGATVKLDGVERGTSALSLKNIEPGNHTLDMSAPGFIGRTIKVRTTGGYRLIVTTQMALAGDSKSPTITTTSTTPSPGNNTKPSATDQTVKILDTPTGFLRVRSTPSTGATEIGRVKPGETFPLLEEGNEWFKIKYNEDKEGWISSRYAQKI